MQVIYPQCARLDVHQKSVEVTAMGDQLEPNERERSASILPLT